MFPYSYHGFISHGEEKEIPCKLTERCVKKKTIVMPRERIRKNQYLYQPSLNSDGAEATRGSTSKLDSPEGMGLNSISGSLFIRKNYPQTTYDVYHTGEASSGSFGGIHPRKKNQGNSFGRAIPRSTFHTTYMCDFHGIKDENIDSSPNKDDQHHMIRGGSISARETASRMKRFSSPRCVYGAQTLGSYKHEAPLYSEKLSKCRSHIRVELSKENHNKKGIYRSDFGEYGSNPRDKWSFYTTHHDMNKKLDPSRIFHRISATQKMKRHTTAFPKLKATL